MRAVKRVARRYQSKPVRANAASKRGIAMAMAALDGDGVPLSAEAFAAQQAQWEREDAARRDAQAELALRISS